MHLKIKPQPHYRLITSFFILWIISAATPASATFGINWLASQTHHQNGISTPNDVAITFQSTAESLRTLHALNQQESFTKIIELGIKTLNAVSYHSSESLSRQIIAGHENGDDISAPLNQLLTLQNPDGGFGEQTDFDSTVLNTAFALEALAIIDSSQTQAIEAALTFLITHQNPDGSFVLNAVNESAIYVTAIANSALQRFLFKQQLLPYVEAANDYLYKNQIEGGGWATDWETAIALLAVASATADPTLYKPAAQVLRANQDKKGSWGEDAYTTALALRALQYVKRIQFPVDPDKGILTGQVVDDNSGLPLAKVEITLSPLAETSTETESDGSFSLTGLEPGNYTLKYQLAGYQAASQEANVSKGQFAELGTIRLPPLPNVGIISGTLTDTTTGQPLSGVLVKVTGAVTAQALTDEQGYYAIVSPPGPVTVTAQLSGYDPLSGTGTIARGVTLSFSPAINPTGTTPANPEITVKGLIQDSETKTPLTDAVITIIGTQHRGQTDNNGAFAIPDVTPGELNIKIIVNGYQTGLFTVLAPPGGVVDLGTTHLPKTVKAATTTLIGQVKDANTGVPIEGASVNIDTLDNSTLTSEDGSYRLEDIDIKAFKITASALKYLTANYNLNLSGSGVVSFDFNLTPAAESGIEIASISTAQTSYEALTGAQMELVLNNKEDQDQVIRFLLKVVNEQGELVEQFTSVINNVVSVEANGQLNTALEWQTGRHQPGNYEVIVQAYHTETGQLLAERSTEVAIEPTKRIGGHVAFGPPIAQLAAKKPIKLTAQIANQGNQNVESTTITATITLKNKGYQQQKSEVSIEPFVQENDLVKSPRGSDIDAAGNLYVANYSKHTVLKITPEGDVSEFATDLHYPIDVDFDQNGNLYVLSYYSYYNKGLVRLGADGSRQEFKIVPTVNYTRSLEVLDDGQILIAASNALYEVKIQEDTNQLKPIQLIKGALSTPFGLAADSQGNLFIADKTGNRIVKFEQGNLSTFISDIKQPYGMTSDEQDNLYVTSFQDNSLIKITKEGTMTTIASGLSGPYDVKIAPDGNFVVSNYNSHEVVSITPEGDVSLLVQPTLHAPTALAYDAQGNLYIGNWNRRNIVKLSPEGVTTNLSSTRSNPRDILTTEDGTVYWIEWGNSLNKIGPNDTTQTTLTTKLYNPYALINAPDNNGFLISEYSKHRISQVSTTGEITPYTTKTQFIYPRNLRTDSLGNLYILSDNGYITQFTHEGQITRVISDLNTPRGLAIDSQGNLYVSEYYNKRILRIDQNNNIEVIAENLPYRPYAIALNSQKELIVAFENNDSLYLINQQGQGSEYTKLSKGRYIYDMLFDPSDNLWIAQYYQHEVVKLNPDKTETRYRLINKRYYPQSLFYDEGIWVGASSSVQHINKEGEMTEKLYKEAATGHTRGIAIDKTGQLWLADANNGVLSRLKADYTVDKRFASLYNPRGIAWVNNALIVANTGRKQGIFRLSDPEALPEIILDGYYELVKPFDSQSVLLSNASSISRFDLNNGSVTQIASGFSNLEALTIASNGHFVTADYHTSRNALAFYDAQGTLHDSFIGLVNPKGLLFDSNGQLLVSNAFPNGIAKLRADGKLQPFSSMTSIESMWLEEDGQILVSRGSEIRKLSKTGESIKSYQVPSYYLKGFLKDQAGQLWIASDNQGALLKMAADGSYKKMASGLYNARDIEVDGNGILHIADYSRGVVTRLNQDHSLSLVAAELPNASAINFSPNDSLFVAYNNTKIAAFDEKAKRTELATTDFIFRGITGLITDNQSTLYPVMADTNRILKIPTSQADTGLEPGEVVYTKTVTIPALSLEGETVEVDLGAWLPTLSGDFQVKIEATGATTSHLVNTLHVGPSASGTLSLAQSQVFPGERAVTGYLSIEGADSTSITQIHAEGTTLSAESNTRGYGIAADNQGNIYSVDSSQKRIVKIAPDGSVSDFVTNLSLGYGLAIDAEDNIYAVNSKNILKITPLAEVSTLATLSGTAYAVAVGYDNQVYAVDSSNRLSRIHADGTVETITTLGLRSPRGLTIDAFGNFYVLNSNSKIIKIPPDGKSASMYFENVKFEFEGVNVTADCSNNLLFAPFGYFEPLDKNIGEETTLVQLIGDTGEVREVLYGPSIDWAMADMDVLFYDRFNQRLLIWTDLNRGKIFSFPVICGGIDVEAHLITRTDVNLESTDPAPTLVQDLENGNKEYIWNLSQVDHQGQKVQLNLLFKDLAEGETRKAATEAFLVFNNSFDPDEPVQVPLSIPTLLATRQMQIAPTLSEERYGAQAPVDIQIEVLNDSDTNFNGTLELTIVDQDDKPVAQLPPIAVTDLAGPASAIYNTQWNTTTTYAGTYKLISRLLNPDRTYDEAERLFKIFHRETNALLSLKTTLDKDSYHSSEAVIIHQRVESLSNNALIDDALITVTITDPSGQVIHTENQAVGQLPPSGISEIRMPYMLNQAEKGTYTVNVIVADSDTQLASQTTEFNVENDLNLAINGQVTTLHERLTANQTQTCTQTLTNQGTQDLIELPVQLLLMDLDTLSTIQTHTTLLNLEKSNSQTFTLNFDNTKGVHRQSHYACVLQAQLAEKWETLDFANFTITPANTSECSTVYAIHDQDLNDSQIFSYDLNTQIIKPLGPLYLDRDLEGLEIAPDTNRLYASTGKPKSRLYEVDGYTGQLTPIGDIGFNEVESLSFHPDGSLWGWAKNGLIQIDRQTGKGDLIYANSTNIQGLAWNNAGTQLYGTSSKGNKSTLWVYDGQILEKACENNLLGEIESLEMRPDDRLVFGLHQQNDLSFHAYDIANCQLVSDARISTPYHDIEAIAWPEASCTAKQQALEGFLTALSSDKQSYIFDSGHIYITLSGQTHHGQLAQTITQTTTQTDQITLTKIQDANQDGIADFLITYPEGTQQILYYLGITEE